MDKIEFHSPEEAIYYLQTYIYDDKPFELELLKYIDFKGYDKISSGFFGIKVDLPPEEYNQRILIGYNTCRSNNMLTYSQIEEILMYIKELLSV